MIYDLINYLININISFFLYNLTCFIEQMWYIMIGFFYAVFLLYTLDFIKYVYMHIY